MADPSDSTDGVLIDSHVHFYECYTLDAFLDGARANFRQAARALGLPPETPGCLCLTEDFSRDYFRTFWEQALGSRDGDWNFRRTAEDESLLACWRGEPKLFIVAGRQVITKDGLEVLALACRERIPDGLELSTLLARVREVRALPVLPWGFGKWTSRRGAHVRELVESSQAGDFYLGDTGYRPWFWPRSPLFDQAIAKGIFVLHGSDPLPFASHQGGAGHYGFFLEGRLDWDRPAAGIMQGVRSFSTQPRSYGEPEQLFRFGRSLLAMQARKHRTLAAR